MNEHIRQPAEQARKYADENRPGSFVKYDPEWFVLYNEKFAELIIRECMSLVSEPGPDMNDTERGILAQIKHHFGIEDRAFKIGSRIKVISGFNVGAKGTVSYIEPTGRMWVLRDGASSDVFYHPDEVIGVEEYVFYHPDEVIGVEE